MTIKKNVFITAGIYIAYSIYVVRKMLLFAPDSTIYDMVTELILKRQSFFLVETIPFVIFPVMQCAIYFHKNYIANLCTIGAHLSSCIKKLLFQYAINDCVIMAVSGIIFILASDRGISLTGYAGTVQMLIFMNVLMFGIFNCVFFIYVMSGRNKRILVAVVIVAVFYGTAVFDRYLPGRGWIDIYQMQNYLTNIRMYVSLIGKILILDISGICAVWGLLWTRDI